MENQHTLTLIKRMRALAETGLIYGENDFDKERYEELYQISMKLLSEVSGKSLTQLTHFLTPAKDYPTPKVDVRGLILNQAQEILLVKEQTDGRWSLPGGWGDIGFSPSEVVEKEVFEETGLEAKATQLLAVYDKRCHPHPPQPYYVYKIVFACHVVGGSLKSGFDMDGVGYFKVDELPPLSEDRILEHQVKELFAQVLQKQPKAIFD